MKAIALKNNAVKMKFPVKAVIGTAAVIMIFLWPLLKLFSEAFIGQNGFTLGYFTEIFSDSGFYEVLLNSLFINILSTIGAAIPGVIFAYIMAYTDIPLKKYFHTLLLIPVVIPSYIVTLAWMQMLSKSGLIYRLTQFDLYSYAGIILMFSVCQYPMIYLLSLSHFRKIPRELEQAADISGCGRLKSFRTILLPMMKGTLANSMLLVFLSCLDNFGIVAFIGIPANIQVLSTDIYKTVISGTDDSFQLSAAKAIILSVIAVLIMAVSKRISDDAHAQGSEKEDMKPRIALGQSKYLLAAVMGIFIFFVNIFPMITLITSALTKAKGVPFSFETASFANFDKVLHNSKSMNGLCNSIILALGTVFICAVIGVTIAYLSERKKNPVAKYIQMIVTFPYSIPGIILGLALILTYAKPVAGVTIYGTIWILLLSYVIRFTSVVSRSANTAFSQLDPAMEEAAEAGGSGNAAKWRKIILPLTSGPVISGMGMVAISSMMELTTSSLLWSGGSETVGVVIFNFTSAGMSNLASAYSSIILILILAVFMLYKLSVLLLTKGGKKYVDSNK